MNSQNEWAGRYFLMRKGYEELPGPDDVDLLAGTVYFNHWSRRLSPFRSLAEGDTLYLLDHDRRTLAVEMRVASRIASPYETLQEGLDQLRAVYGMFENEDDGGWPGYNPAPGPGYLLAFVIARTDGQVAWFERIDHPDSWQFPQGGINRNERPAAAAARELCEETALGGEDVEWVAELDDWLPYSFPGTNPGSHLGQIQRWFLVRTIGDAEPDLEAAADAEFTSWRWATLDAHLDQVVHFKADVYRRVIEWIRPQLSQG